MAKQSKKFGPSVVLGSAALVLFVAAWEGGKRSDGSAVAYADTLAGGIPTVCAGLTRHITDTPIVVGEVWPAAKCVEEETKAVVKVQQELEKCFTRIPPQSVFDAATSHAWNLGSPATCKSSAMRAWNEGNWELGCRRIAFADSGKRIWSYVKAADGSFKFVRGLANRRDAEVKLCLGG